jgi:hypothetical protein
LINTEFQNIIKINSVLDQKRIREIKAVRFLR